MIPDNSAVARLFFDGRADKWTLAALLASLLAILSGAGVLFLSMFGGIWPVFDIAAHATWHACGAITGGLVALLCTWSRRPFVAVTALAVGAVLTLAVPVITAQASTLDADVVAMPPAPGAIRVVSLNTWHDLSDPEALVEFLEQAQADVVVLAEFGPPKRPLLQRLMKSYPYQTGCAQSICCSMMLLSRHPIKYAASTSRHRSPGPPRVVASFGPELGGVTVIGVHLMRPIDSYKGNFNETVFVADMVRSIGDKPVIVAGDFNLTGFSANWSMFKERSGLKHMGRFLPSWPARPRLVPQLAIDHVFVSRDIMIERAALGRSVGSDHRPLIVDMRLQTKLRSSIE